MRESTFVKLLRLLQAQLRKTDWLEKSVLDKHSSLFCHIVSDKEKGFIRFAML
jgi:hypothetical protein